MIKNKKILITGGAGFIGYHLIKKLYKNNRLLILDNFQRGKMDNELKLLIKNENVKLLNVDLVSLKKFSKNSFDYIFFLASVVGVKNVNQNPFLTLETNVQTIFNTLNFAKSHKNTKLIYFSTSEVYSPLYQKKIKKFPIKENVDLLLNSEKNPRDTYLISKIFGEKLIEFYGKPYLILRPHNIYGPRMGLSHVVPEQILKIKKNIRSKVFSPNHKRAFCFIDDAINQILFLTESKKYNNNIFNIGNHKEPIKMLKLCGIIKKKLKSKTILLNEKNTRGSVSTRVPFIDKCLRKMIKTNLNKGLDKTIKWYLDNEKI